MPRLGFIFILLLLLPLPLDAGVMKEVRLNGMAKEESPGQSRLILDLTSLPAYRVENSGQRVDLILPRTTLSSAWRAPLEDGRVIKVLFARKEEELIVSFLLRQPPARILTSTEDSRRLVLDLFWQEPLTRTALVFAVPGMPTIQKGRPIATVKPASKYGGDWERFFREYRTPLSLEVPLDYSLLPIPEDAGASLPAKTYLESRAVATAGNPYRAEIALRTVEADLEQRHPLLPHYQLLRAEIALATGAFDEAATLLEEDRLPGPAGFGDLRQARLATALAKAGKIDQAFRAFSARGMVPSALADLPFSLESAAAVLLARKEYATAAELYRALAETLNDPAHQALARFAWALAASQGGARDLALEELKKIKAAFPTQEAGERARLKLLDYGVLSEGGEGYPRALQGYEALAEQASLKGLREEAAFKLVLVLQWSGQQERSVRQLQEFLRNFRGGLRSEAEALMLEILPPVIQSLVARGEDLPAVILLDQNRQLLTSGDLGWTFLLDLAHAFSRLGLLERASRVYLFMLEGPREDSDKERLYLPLVELFWERDEFLLAGEYAGKYLERYPRGKDRAQIFIWRLRALQDTGRLSEAADLLKSSKIPWNRELELEAARILTAAGDYRLLSDIAGRQKRDWEPFPQTLLLHAEALRRTGRDSRALPLYRRLMKEEAFADQASFCCAEILWAQDKETEALKILSHLVETGKSPLWRKLAEETLHAAAM